MLPPAFLSCERRGRHPRTALLFYCVLVALTFLPIESVVPSARCGAVDRNSAEPSAVFYGVTDVGSPRKKYLHFCVGVLVVHSHRPGSVSVCAYCPMRAKGPLARQVETYLAASVLENGWMFWFCLRRAYSSLEP